MFVTAAMVAAVLCCQGGCVATKYRLAKKNTPPVQLLNVAFPPTAPLQPTLAALIIYGGPGSWKREALWDEYVVTLQNSGERPVIVDAATLTDSDGMTVAAGVDPWALEKQSKILEKQYRAGGLAFIRAAGPGVLIVGAGAAAAAATTTSVFRIGRYCGRGRGYGIRPAGLLRHRVGYQSSQQESRHSRVHAPPATAADNARIGRYADREFVFSDGARPSLSGAALVERIRQRPGCIATRLSARAAPTSRNGRRCNSQRR